MSFLRRYLKSAAGRTCIVGSTVVLAAHLLPNTIWLDKWEAFWTFRVFDKPLPVSSTLSEKFQQVLNDLKIPPNVQKSTKIFHVDGFDTFHAGTPNGQFGGILIGVPTHFEFEDLSGFRRNLIVVRQKVVDWERRDAQRLLEMTLLPDEAQKFAMASDFLRVQMGEIYYRAFGVAAALLLQPVVYEWVKNKFDLPNVRLRHRLFAIFATTALVIYLSQLYVDAVSCIIDKVVDNKLAEIGVEYIRGGREYYVRQIGKNLALRSLLEAEAPYHFTPEGNNKFYIRYRTLPVTQRKRFFEDKLQTFNQHVEAV